jgi:curli production assembly/transport component CsgG/holdfast attachment protein HfaB
MFDDLNEGKKSPQRKTARAASLSKSLLGLFASASILAGCQTGGYYSTAYVEPLSGSPVHTNNTPYTACLVNMASAKTEKKPSLTVGHISDKTGQKDYAKYTDSAELTQGVSEMVISAFFKTRQVTLTERLDIRVPLAEQQLVQSKAISGPVAKMNVIPSNFVVLGALTELNYNISSGGARLFVAGNGGGVRKAVINVGLDLRLVDVRSFRTLYVTSLQKQIIGYEVEAGIYRFFGEQLIEFDAGAVKNEPLQLGVRSVVELATYQILTEGLGFPAGEDEHCKPGMDTYKAQYQETKNDA